MDMTHPSTYGQATALRDKYVMYSTWEPLGGGIKAPNVAEYNRMVPAINSILARCRTDEEYMAKINAGGHEEFMAEVDLLTKGSIA